MKLFSWRCAPSWIAVAHAESVAKARELLLNEVGGIDESCVVRAKARKVISEDAPEIWLGNNAEFALTDSAEVEEQDAELTRLRAELAACHEERVAALNEKTAADIELGQARERSAGLEKRLNELVPTLGWVNQMAGQYSRECTAEREKRELAEQASVYNLDVCEQMEERAKLAEEQRDALAAALEKANDILTACGFAYAVDPANPSTVLAARDADQRRKAAAWALRHEAEKLMSLEKNRGNLSLIAVERELLNRADAIERDEAEVPND